ncbi:hypothetical protein HS088_TW16G00391 [Tripterygium wilfordii]|uniref:Uncharacterized protein n=1 Tax=Tripterygium wilfordii TaxID=458696 RepID=A0A7J7CIS1_TRIWF|nr:hypothetical protein HS088_TW16G00391 [Tripterygium wilfordii]
MEEGWTHVTQLHGAGKANPKLPSHDFSGIFRRDNFDSLVSFTRRADQCDISSKLSTTIEVFQLKHLDETPKLIDLCGKNRFAWTFFEHWTGLVVMVKQFFVLLGTKELGTSLQRNIYA